MTYRIYLRDANQRVTDKTATESKAAALAAFGELVDRAELDGQKLLAVLNQDGKKIAHHNFQAQPGDADHWRGRLDQITWPA
ncbi:hypothetical protein [Castellaniella sp. GW247-6E4]|uniref:hypothetical protein n=1 Tax=Castellaniella sp. GW247-6E4 TaxID=3140380 RepID=UPI003314564B